jgi:hypothetical protein
MYRRKVPEALMTQIWKRQQILDTLELHLQWNLFKEDEPHRLDHTHQTHHLLFVLLHPILQIHLTDMKDLDTRLGVVARLVPQEVAQPAADKLCHTLLDQVNLVILELSAYVLVVLSHTLIQRIMVCVSI